MKLPTINICDGDGSYIVINESDFDKDNHKVFVEKKESKPSKKSKVKKG